MKANQTLVQTIEWKFIVLGVHDALNVSMFRVLSLSSHISHMIRVCYLRLVLPQTFILRMLPDLEDLTQWQHCLQMN